MQVSLCPETISELEKSSLSLAALASADVNPKIEIYIDSVDHLIASLRVADRELCDQLMRGPVYRFVQQHSQFKAWAAQARDILIGSRL